MTDQAHSEVHLEVHLEAINQGWLQAVSRELAGDGRSGLAVDCFGYISVVIHSLVHFLEYTSTISSYLSIMLYS